MPMRKRYTKRNFNEGTNRAELYTSVEMLAQQDVSYNKEVDECKLQIGPLPQICL